MLFDSTLEKSGSILVSKALQKLNVQQILNTFIMKNKYGFYTLINDIVRERVVMTPPMPELRENEPLLKLEKTYNDF